YYGAATPASSLASLINASMYQTESSALTFLIGIVLTGLFLMGCVLAVKKSRTFAPPGLLIFLLVTVVLLIVMEHYTADAAFPMERTGLHIILLFGLLVFFLVNDVQYKSGSLVAPIISMLPALLLIVNFFMNANLRYTF